MGGEAVTKKDRGFFRNSLANPDARSAGVSPASSGGVSPPVPDIAHRDILSR
jgi:hypothetical protein